MTTDAKIRLARTETGILKSIAVTMPIWFKESNSGFFKVGLPLIGIETTAKDEEDSDIAIMEAIKVFCLVAERFGNGVEKELQALGWKPVDETTGEEILGFDSKDPDSMLDRLMRTGENYANEIVELDILQPSYA